MANSCIRGKLTFYVNWRKGCCIGYCSTKQCIMSKITCGLTFFNMCYNILLLDSKSTFVLSVVQDPSMTTWTWSWTSTCWTSWTTTCRTRRPVCWTRTVATPVCPPSSRTPVLTRAVTRGWGARLRRWRQRRRPQQPSVRTLTRITAGQRRAPQNPIRSRRNTPPARPPRTTTTSAATTTTTITTTTTRPAPATRPHRRQQQQQQQRRRRSVRTTTTRTTTTKTTTTTARRTRARVKTATRRTLTRRRRRARAQWGRSDVGPGPPSRRSSWRRWRRPSRQRRNRRGTSASSWRRRRAWTWGWYR